MDGKEKKKCWIKQIQVAHLTVRSGASRTQISIMPPGFNAPFIYCQQVHKAKILKNEAIHLNVPER